VRHHCRLHELGAVTGTAVTTLETSAPGQEHAPAVARAGDRFEHSTGMDACLRFGDLPVRGPRGLSVAVGQGEQPRGRPAIAWLRLSDTGIESAAGAAAALLLAGFRRLASTRRTELRRGVLAVAMRASRALRDRCRSRGQSRRDLKGGPDARAIGIGVERGGANFDRNGGGPRVARVECVLGLDLERAPGLSIGSWR